jgi:hypothetical protein
LPSTVIRIMFSANAFRDVDAVVIVERRDLVVDDLHDDVGRLSLDEARVHDVVGMHVTAAFELDLLRRELHLGRDRLHRPARARGRQTDVVLVDHRGAPLEPLVARVADETQARVRLVRDIREASAQQPGQPRRHDGRAVLDRDQRHRTPRRIVDARHHFLARCRTHLRFVRQLLQRVVVPELDLDATIQRAALRRRVRTERPRRAPAVAFDRGRRQTERLLHGERDAARTRAGEADLVAVDALVALGERRIVGVADEFHEHVLPIAHVRERLADLLHERGRHVDGLFVETQRRDDVLDACAALVAVDVAQTAQGLHAADFDASEVLEDYDLVERRALLHLVVPNLDFDAAILRAARFGRVRRDGFLVAGPFIRDALGTQSERALQQLRNLAGSLSRQALVVAEHSGERRRQRLRIGVPDEMQPHVAPVAHAREDSSQIGDRRLRNLGDTRLEVDRRHEIHELHRLELLGGDFAHLDPVPGLRLQDGWVVNPLGERPVAGQVAFDGLAARRLSEELCFGARAEERGG